jgi:hypothetical protein
MPWAHEASTGARKGRTTEAAEAIRRSGEESMVGRKSGCGVEDDGERVRKEGSEKES